MGVPDMEHSVVPVKKRQRLSLKSTKQKQQATVAQHGIKECTERETGLFSELAATSSSSSSLTVSEKSAFTLSTESNTSGKSDNRVPAVSSLENLGNTCFMNSILQVLRYTPGFLENIVCLYKNIQAVEKIKRKNKGSEEEDASEEENNCKRHWRVVKNVYKVYRDLSILEDKYEEVASDDIMSMAIRPNKFLHAIRELNPMYDGHMQHDAQEFLRCFLCYLQDAEKAVQKFCSHLPNMLSSKVNNSPARQNFVMTSEGTLDYHDPLKRVGNVAKVIEEVNVIGENDIKTISNFSQVKFSLFPKAEMESEAVKSPTKIAIIPQLGETAGVVDEARNKVVAMDVSAKTETMMGGISGSVLSSIKDQNTVANVDVLQRGKSKIRHGRNKPYETNTENMIVDNAVPISNASVNYLDQNKPSTANMFLKFTSKRRLGMRGALLKKSSAGGLFDEDKLCEEESQPKQMTDNCDKDKNDTENDRDKKLLHGTELQTGYKNVKPFHSDLNAFETCLTSQSDGNQCCAQESVLESQSFPDISSYNLTKLVNDDADSDSDSDDIVQQKKRAKILRNTPRRSPRKCSSESVKAVRLATAKHFEMSKFAFGLQSDRLLGAKKPQHGLFHKISRTTTNVVTSGSQNESAAFNQPHVEMQAAKTVECDLNEIEFPKANSTLTPIVKLENCDYVLSESGTSISAAYATQCLTPVETCDRKTSRNYLKQRDLLLKTKLADDMPFHTEMLNSPIKSRSKYDLIERNFQGTMMLKTKCLQCESSRERQEDFHDVSVPVRIEHCDSDDEEENKKPKCGLLDLIEASTEVEKLLADNKYYCDECKCYVEAERSMYYDVMPDILTLHLKRFSAETSNPGCISKINDHVEIPMTLPCLGYRCPQTCLRPDHKYQLYGIVTHSGVTLTSGHYLSYVRALPTKDKCSLSQADDLALMPDAHEKETKCMGKPGKRKAKLPARFDNFIANTKVKAFEAVASKKAKPCVTESLACSQKFINEWFECDDETVRVFEECDFVDLLNENSGSLLGTPYLLFYHKFTMM